MEPCSIKKLLTSVFYKNPVVRIEELKEIIPLSKRTGSSVEIDTPSSTIFDNMEGNNIFEQCFLCGSLASLTELVQFVLDFNILLDNFPCETELYRSSKYCSGCYSSMSLLQSKYSELVKLREELDSLVFCIKSILRLRRQNLVLDASTSDEGEDLDNQIHPEIKQESLDIDSSKPEQPLPPQLVILSVRHVEETANTTEDDTTDLENENEPVSMLPLDLKIEEEDVPFSCCTENDLLRNHPSDTHPPGETEQSQPYNNPSITVTCPYCDQTIESIVKFDQHFKMNHPGHALQCEKCDEVFESIKKLRSHENAAHKQNTTARKYKKRKGQELPICSRCRKRFLTGSQLRTHFRNVHEKKPVLDIRNDYKPFTCQKCRLVFTTKMSLLSHQRRAHPKNRRRFVCSQCKEGFNRKVIWESHFHKEDGEVAYKCFDCQFEGPSWTVIYSHQLSNHHEGRTTKRAVALQSGPIFCPICRKNFKKKIIFDQHIHNGQDVVYKCAKCEFVSKRWNAIPEHEKRDHSSTHDGRQYCSGCRKFFKKQEMFDNHFHTATGMGIAYNCPRQYCPYQSKNWRSVLSHEALRHPALDGMPALSLIRQQESRPQSSVQSESFSLIKANFRKCDQCQETFPTFSEKAFHVREAHGSSQSQAYKCFLCAESYNFRYELERHLKSHERVA